jgi:hypothetical protein
MWRAMFLGVGTYVAILGAECMAIDKAIMAPDTQSPPPSAVARMTPAALRSREVVPPPWAPWSFMSGGAVVILYSFTLPQKMKG